MIGAIPLGFVAGVAGRTLVPDTRSGMRGGALIASTGPGGNGNRVARWGRVVVAPAVLRRLRTPAPGATRSVRGSVRITSG